MDNITHSLAGLLLGEAAARGPREDAPGLPAESRRTLLVVVSVIGSNLPDIDVLYSALSGDPLDYALEHRGYTHTLVGVLAGAALLWLGCEAWMRARRLTPTGSERAWIGALALGAPLLHLLMDYANSYGVHPFWPFDDRWIYGDSVFIIEPLLWASAAPLVFLLRTRTARATMALILAIGVGLSFASGLAPLASSLALLVLVGLMLLLGRRARPRTALSAAACVWLAVTAVFVWAGRTAAAHAEGYAVKHFAHARLLDHALTPSPEDPLCWELLLIEIEGERYIVRRGELAVLPALQPARACRTRLALHPAEVPLGAVPDAGDASIKWYGEFSMPRTQLAELARSQCRAAAFMRFARAPWSAGRPVPLLGDLRFLQESRQGTRAASFAQVPLRHPPRPCPWLVPPWQPPRRDVLRDAASSGGLRTVAQP